MAMIHHFAFGVQSLHQSANPVVEVEARRRDEDS
jgi:hypothetical protein